MKFTLPLIATLAAISPAAAAPAATAVSMMADDKVWTIENMQRVCDAADTECTTTFRINTPDAPATDCKMFSQAGSDASKIDGGPTDCGDFTVTSGWSGQGGPGNEFTTWSVVDLVNRLIVWPSYKDKQLEAGNVVTPDQKYMPQSLP